MASGLRLPVGVGVSATNACCCRSDGRDPPHEARLCSPQAGLKTTVCFASRLCRPGVRSSCCPPRPDNSRYFHSCLFVTIRGSFVVQNDPQRRTCRTDLGLESPSYMTFVSIRVHSWFRTTRSEEPFGAVLGLESPSYKNSCPFVSIRGSETSAAKTLPGRSRAGKPELHEFVSIRVHSWFKTPRSRSPSATDLGLEGPSYRKSCPFVSIRVHSWFKTTPREAPSGQISGWKARAT